MKRSRKPLQYVEVAGRMVPVDTLSPRSRALEIAAVIAGAVITGYLVALLFRGP